MPLMTIANDAVVPGYYLVCYNTSWKRKCSRVAVVPGYYLVCYNFTLSGLRPHPAVVPGYYLVCYNRQQACYGLRLL